MGLFEFFMLGEEMREMLMQEASTGELRSCGRKQGARSLRDSGLLAVFDGHTTLEEVGRVTLSED